MTAVADLLVVGAGPAGLSAALAATRQGLDVVMVDEQPRPGGQILRQPPETFEVAGRGAPSSGARGRSMLAEAVAAERISWHQATTAWGVFDPANGDGVLTLAVHAAGESHRLHGRSLVVATGAYDLPLAFPGWTLPGVMTAGGVQAATKGQQLLPASRFVLAGSHPLLLVVADQLLGAGAEIAGIAFAPALPALGDALRGARALAADARSAGELAGALARLRRARVPLRFGATVTAAEGEEAVERVRIADRRGGERSVACDGLVLGYGFLPATELARQAGCALEWRAAAGGWVVAHDELMRTSRPRVFVAGEPAGVGGAVQAAAEGALAALGAATDLGRRPPASAVRRARADRRAARRFSTAVQRLFPSPTGRAVVGLLTDGTVVCRCEDVTAGTVRGLLADNPHIASINSVKLACRTGMGSCQGRCCERSVAELTAAARGGGPAAAGTFTARAPVKPVPLRVLAELPPG